MTRLASVKVIGDGTVNIALGEAECDVSADVVARSQLLTDLIQHADVATDVVIPVEAAAMTNWLRYLHHCNALQCNPPAVQGVTDIESKKQLLQVLLLIKCTSACGTGSAEPSTILVCSCWLSTQHMERAAAV